MPNREEFSTRKAGLTTYCGIVQPWECDRNHHWNVRFYIRAFQMASEAFVLAVMSDNPGAATALGRHMRFHRELFVAASVEIRSARILHGPYAGCIVHLLESSGRLCATAIDRPGVVLAAGPEWHESDVSLAMPRSLDPEPHQLLPPRAPEDSYTPVGIVRLSDLDHSGGLLMSNAFLSCSSSSYRLLEHIGFSREWTEESGCSRMAVEVKVTRHGSCAAGEALEARSRISRVAKKTFSVRHQLETANGTGAIASIEQFMVVTDLTTRRAVPIPDHLRSGLELALRSATQNIEAT